MNEQKMRVERSRKPAKCPVCGASPVASILSPKIKFYRRQVC